MKCNKMGKRNSSKVKTEKPEFIKSKNGIKENLSPSILFSFRYSTIICVFILIKKKIAAYQLDGQLASS